MSTIKTTALNLRKVLKLHETPEKQVTLALALSKEVILPTSILLRKTSVGSTTIPHQQLHYYCRMASILKKVIENPCGVQKIAKSYKTKKKDSVKPVRMTFMNRRVAAVMLKLLKAKGLVDQNAKGYYASKKAKDLILSVYQVPTLNKVRAKIKVKSPK